MSRAEHTFRILAAATVHEGRIGPEYASILERFAEALELDPDPILAEAERGLRISDLLPHHERKRQTLYAYIVEVACVAGDPPEEVVEFLKHLAGFFSIEDVGPRIEAEIERGRERRRRLEAKSARDLAMESHLRAIGIWLQLGPALAVAAAAAARLWVLAGVSAALGILLFFIGFRLARYSNGARVTAAIFAFSGLAWLVVEGLNVPPGVGAVQRAVSWLSLAAAALVFVVLLNPRAAEVCSGTYHARVERTPHLKPNAVGSPLFWIPMVFLGIQGALLWLGR